jgi:hypothetical protein
LDRLEWDFTACARPRLYFCWTYEFARQMAREHSGFAELVKAARRKKFETGGNRHYELQGPANNQGERCRWVIDAPQGFATQPYLSLGHKPTCQSYHPFRSGYPFAVRRYPLREVASKGRYSFDFDWSCSPKALTQAFEKWMKERRPTPPREWRRLPLEETYRADLRALGAYRLIHHLKSAAKADRYTTALDPLGRGLYLTLRQWYRAEKRAKKILKSWKKRLNL